MLVTLTKVGYPFKFPSAETQERYSVGVVRDPISTIENLVKDSEVVGFKFSAEKDFSLRKAMNYDVPILLHVQTPVVRSILDAVRNRVLDWSLKLEKEGVLGDGMTFSHPEQERAHAINITNITGNVGVVGDVAAPANVAASTGHISQTIINPQSVIEAVDALRNHLDALPSGKRHAAEEELNALEAEARSDKPNQSRLRSGLGKIGQGAAEIADKVVQAGVRALIDYALGG